ncbi:MAG: HNH endonuclease family protein [Alphaproteobacteria bacterium]
MFGFVLSPIVTAYAESQPYQSYQRAQWLKYWADNDGDCQNTRHEVLQEQSLIPATLDAAGCRVVKGLWIDPYTGIKHTDPAELDIDHLIPLAEAHRSGGNLWNHQQRRDFANDLKTPGALVAVALGINRSKGKRDPSRWLPPQQHCQYVENWLAVKEAYGLTLDVSETRAIAQVQQTHCPQAN